MKHRSEGVTAFLGMPGFVVGAQLEVAGETWLHLESTAEVVGCSSCGTRAVGHGRRRVKVRDLAIAGATTRPASAAAAGSRGSGAREKLERIELEDAIRKGAGGCLLEPLAPRPLTVKPSRRARGEDSPLN